MWDSEKEFIRDYLNSIDFAGNSVHIITEYRTGYGFPDILIVNYNEQIVSERLRNTAPLVSRSFDNNCAYMMAFLSERRWIKYERLRSIFNAYNGSLKALIENLEDRNLIVKDGDRLKSRPKSEIFAIKSIIVIEAKLRNWRKAILQAQRYLWFTNSSNILIPMPSNNHLNGIRNICRNYHVGLITLSENQMVFPVIRIKRKTPYNTHLAWLLNELLMEEKELG